MALSAQRLGVGVVEHGAALRERQDVVDLFGWSATSAAVRFATQVLGLERDVASGKSAAGLVSAALLPRLALVFATSAHRGERGTSGCRAASWRRGWHEFTYSPDNRFRPIRDQCSVGQHWVAPFVEARIDDAVVDRFPAGGVPSAGGLR